MLGQKSLLVLILVSIILLAGCTSPPTGTGTTGAQPQGGTPSTGGATGANTGAATGNQSAGGNGGAGAGTQNQQGGLGDIVGKTYEQLLGLGVPVQCDITSTSNGQTTTAKVYMQGKDNVRSEVAVNTAGSTCTKIVSIGKGNIYYMGCMEGALFPSTGGAENPFAGCDWLSMSANQSSTPGASTNSVPDYSDVPSSQINCQPWIYDASKFAVNGKVCDLDQIMKDLTANMPSGTGGY